MGRPGSSIRCLYCGDRIHEDKHGRLRDRSGRLTCVFPPHPYHAQQLELIAGAGDCHDDEPVPAAQGWRRIISARGLKVE